MNSENVRPNSQKLDAGDESHFHKKILLTSLSGDERRFILKYRKRIETVFAQLANQFNIERVLAKNFVGLPVRLLSKILAFNLCLLEQFTKIKTKIK